MTQQDTTHFGAKTFARLKQSEHFSVQEASGGDPESGSTTDGWEHLADSEPTEVAVQFWSSLPEAVQDELNSLLPRGAEALGKRRRNQRHFLGMKRPAGVLLAWRSSSNVKNRSKFAIILCQRCNRVWEIRMDHFLGKVGRSEDDNDCNESCGCGAQANRDRIFETALLLIRDCDQNGIAQELELGLRHRAAIAKEFRIKNKFLPWLKSGILVYLFARIWKDWADGLWARLGASRMPAMWNCVQRCGLRRVLRSSG